MSEHDSARWSAESAERWFSESGWKLGCNFIPSTAVNQLEMWQEETFDPATIERELAWASGIGMNAVRVYLHDLAWEGDRQGFKERVDRFLSIADSCGIRVMPVLFDDCWFPDPAPGPQPPPVPGIHNSRWLQSPGITAACDRKQWPRLEAYVHDICGTFSDDARILCWDVYNEPGNHFLPVMGRPALARVGPLLWRFLRFRMLPLPTLPLVRAAFTWVREVSPKQPLTAGVWIGHRKLNRLLIELSDVVSFHNYRPAEHLRGRIAELKALGRPLICTEYMARTAGSTIETCTPVFHAENVSCFNWGLVQGKTQTVYSWKDHGETGEPAIWFHDLLRPDGTAYREEEVAVLRSCSSGQDSAADR